MQPINVVGAGFSGLATAYFLTRGGRDVRVFEKTNRAGGLIQSIRTEHGLVETAANGILNSARLESIAAEIGVPLLPARRDARKRFIFRGRPKQFPLSLSDVTEAGIRSIKSTVRWRPRPFESVAAWGLRVLGSGVTDYLLSPALSGIYAGDPNRLSARLIFGRADLPTHLATYKPAQAKVKGTVAPPNGMQQLVDGLADYLGSRGVEFNFNHTAPTEPDEPTILCVSARAAAKYLADRAPEISEQLSKIEMLSLITATCFFPTGSQRLKAFGCLFPLDQGFRSRGVLFNDCIFDDRGPAQSETWIFGGALDPEVLNLDDDRIREQIMEDRARFYGRNDEPRAIHITRQPNALPHYSLDLERVLTTLSPLPANVSLVGNYLGRIGLGKLLERAAYVADHLPANR